MPDENCQKVKLLKLMELLRQETDENHPITTSQIIRRLNEMGISCERRTVGKDMRTLQKQGFEIMSELKGHENSYWIADRSFELPEIKILMDAVQAASFIPEDKSKELIQRLAFLGGKHKAALLKGNIVRFNTRKHSNETVLATVETLENAILKNKKAAFCYFDVNEKGERVFRRDGEEYITEPVALVFNEDNYYLITYNEKHECTTNYRVDRIDGVRILREKISETARDLRKKVSRYTEEAFKMFNGPEEAVTLRFSDKLLNPVYDKFGEHTRMKRLGADTLEATVNVRIAPTFFGWLFQFGTEMEIVSPESLKEEYKKRAAAVAER